MWKRFLRVIRSFLGFFVSGMENPKLILEQNIRDMRDQVPTMNNAIATVRANVTLLEKEDAHYAEEVTTLTAKIKAAIQAKREDIAGQFAGQLEKTKAAAVRCKQQLMTAKAAYDKAQQVKTAFMRTIETKTSEAMEAIRESERAEWQAKVADTMESFQVAGIDATHDEMLRKVQEKTAMNEARMEMALDNVNTEGLKIEEDAEHLRAQELVKQFKLEMGMTAPPPTEDIEKSIGRTAQGVAA